MIASFTGLALIATVAYGNPLLGRATYTSTQVCGIIASSISSSSKVFYPGSAGYGQDTYHWSSSSAQSSACTVEPATTQDVGTILQILGRTRTPFGVKSGGHIANPGFSSSPGILIAMSRFNTVQYDPVSQTATIGTGLIWDDVYDALAPYNVNVVGGRESGVGVGGLTLGGGYSWLSGQYGLTIDTVTAFELVKPDGTVATVTEQSDSELFFGLKGGLNNFGIVTRFTLKTFPQTAIWGGEIVYTLLSIPEVTKAVVKFSATNTDPKASIAASYGCVALVPFSIVLLFYDAPTPPQGIFDDFFNILLYASDVRQRSFSNFVKSTPANITANTRGVFQTVPILTYSEPVMDTIVGQNQFWCAQELLATGPFVLYIAEPIMPNILNHTTSPSAYPPTRNQAFSPFNIHFGWVLGLLDPVGINNIKASANVIRNAAIADGQDLSSAPMYPNYALYDTPLQQMYGGNVARLSALRARVDPTNVMGLAGGFRF
ncbi:FAD dependent oxidoreductase [Amanita muscaria]